jgi:hypothetical protein
MPSITVRVQLGPLVSVQVEGHNCKEVSEALVGYEHLTKQVEGLCSGLAEKVYPEEERDHKDDHDSKHDQVPKDKRDRDVENGGKK